MCTRTMPRLLLWAGWIGLALAFMPYYMVSRTALQAGAEQLPDISMPGIGMLPKESSRAVITIGLPCSPWFRYEKNVRSDTTWTAPPPSDASIKFTNADGQPLPPESIKSLVSVKNFSTKFKVDYSWNVHPLSWSALLALVSIGLLILGRWKRTRSEARSKPISQDPDALA